MILLDMDKFAYMYRSQGLGRFKKYMYGSRQTNTESWADMFFLIRFENPNYNL